MTEFYMDVPEVRGEAQFWGETGQTLRKIESALEATITTLQAASLFSMGTTEPLKQQLQQIKQVIDMVEKKVSQLSEDLGASATAYENGDEAGKALFY